MQNLLKAELEVTIFHNDIITTSEVGTKPDNETEERDPMMTISTVDPTV